MATKATKKAKKVTKKAKAAKKKVTRIPGRKGPRAQSLPGMERVRDSTMDALCEDVGDALDKINTGTEEKKSAMQAALKRMQTLGVQSYGHAGVQLLRAPGEEVLKVRKKKDADASDEVDPTDAEAAKGPESGIE